ncbi:PH domain-containing protein [Patescibacteria group bacterium]
MKQLHPRSVWLFFAQYLVVIFFVYFFFISWLVSLLLSAFTDSIGGLFGIGLLNIIIWIVFSYAFAKWSYNAWKYELSEDALKVEKGVIWKRYVSIPYERIQNVDIHRGIMDRLLGLSDLHIQTAGFSGYGNRGFGNMFSSEGRLPGLLPQDAEALRENLVKRAKGKKPSGGV